MVKGLEFEVCEVKRMCGWAVREYPELASAGDYPRRIHLAVLLDSCKWIMTELQGPYFHVFLFYELVLL